MQGALSMSLVSEGLLLLLLLLLQSIITNVIIVHEYRELFVYSSMIFHVSNGLQCQISTSSFTM
jgi:cell division protein FtsL